MSVKVWRVEDKNGCGPYVGCTAWWWFNRNDDETNGHPTPNYDKGIMRSVGQCEICAFEDLNQARRWFDDDTLLRLEIEGFELKEVGVKRITARGYHQILVERR